MNRVVSREQGYTVVETLIFLAVTGVLFISTMQLIGGQQGKTQFYQAINDVKSQIQDVANDVATGFYHNPLQFKCMDSSGKPLIVPFGGAGTDTQGTNEDCIFIGRVMQFAPLPVSDTEKLVIYSVAGLRKTPSGKEVSTYAETIPTAIARGSGFHNTVPDGEQQTDLPGGIETFRVQYIDGGVVNNVAGFGFMSTLAQYSLGVIASGSRSVDIIAVGSPASPPSPSENIPDFVDNIDALNTAAVKNPSGGIVVCFNSGTSNQHAIITLGTNKSLTPVVTIKSGQATTDGTGKCI